MDSFYDVWNVVCDYCRSQITDVAYNTWISRIEPVTLDFDKREAYLMAPHTFHRSTLERCYKTLIRDGFEVVFGQAFDIIFTVPEEQNKFEEKKEENIDKGYSFTFDNFIVGNSNKFAHAGCLAVAENPGNAYNPLFLYGNSGLGKTHLLYAIGNEIKKNDPNKDVCYVKGDEFINELVNALHFKTTEDFRQKYRKVDVILMDDIQFIGGKEATQIEFFHTFEDLYMANKQIVVTSDRPPKEIKILDDRIRSRFEGGLMADIQPPDTETRISIIKRKADLMNIIIPNDVCEYIASNIKSNIRQLEGVVKKIQAKNHLDGEKITIKTVHDIIADVINNEVPPEVTVEKIVEEVSRTYNVTPEELRNSKNRSQYISKPRQIAIYITNELTSLTQDSIGKEFGGRDHSTIKYAIDKTSKMMKTDSKIKAVVEDIMKNCKVE